MLAGLSINIKSILKDVMLINKSISYCKLNVIDKLLYRGYTKAMKTAVSLPDRLYKDAEKAAKSMGIPRSQLFAQALEEFITHHTKEDITGILNKVYSNGSDTSDVENVSIERIRELTKNDTW
jgi:hypothetical protein